MVDYNKYVIQEFANKLYQKATWIIIKYTVLGLIGGIIVGLFLNNMVQGKEYLLYISIFLGGSSGYDRGTERAFVLKLQAQTALCQTEIEENTRRAISVGGTTKQQMANTSQIENRASWKIEDPTATWKCPKCEQVMPNTSFVCSGCGQRLV